jgi:hypothetical protein
MLKALHFALVTAAVAWIAITPRTASANCGDAELRCVDPRVIKEIQKVLSSKGSLSGPINGKYNFRFRAALDDFVEKRGGKPGSRVLSAGVALGLWGKDFDYARVNKEGRREFLSDLGITASADDQRLLCDDADLKCLGPEVVRAIQSVLRAKAGYKGAVDGAYTMRLRAVTDDYLESQGENIRILDETLVRLVWNIDIRYATADNNRRLKFLKSIGLELGGKPARTVDDADADTPDDQAGGPTTDQQTSGSIDAKKE